MSTAGPLSISLGTSQTKTAIPLFAEGTYVKWRFTSVKQGQSEKGPFLALAYDLVEPAPDTDGGRITPGAMGSKFFENIQLYAKPDATDPEWFLKKLGTRIDALLGTADADNKKGKPIRPDFNAETAQAMVGQILVAKMKVSTYEGQTRNEFASVHFPSDIAV